MIGIYKYTNKQNGKVYIGLSNNIERRCLEHYTYARNCPDTYFHKALAKYGVEGFEFEIIETFTENNRELLGEREKYWIQYYDSYHNGYNETTGGDISCGRAKLNEQDVINIRKRYANLERCMVVYQDYKNYIGRSGFNKIWKGVTWKHIMPEVYTKENKLYHKMHTGNSGMYNGRSKLSDFDVIDIRTRYKNGESIESIYLDYKDKNTIESFRNVVCGYNWKHIQI